MTSQTTDDPPSDPGAFAAAAARVRTAETTPRDEAERLVAAMTLEEKLGCLDGDTDAWPGVIDMVSGGYHRHTYPAAAVPRLGVPGLAFSDGPRGCVIGEKTAFPVSMARGATWDPDLEERIGEAIGAELRTIGATYYGGVCVNLLRHPGWGRAQETYGEEPHHVGEMGRALALGAQRHVMACVKHFALNSMENARFTVDVRADERALHEVYLPHFRRIVESGVASVMSAYNSVNGDWCGESAQLLTEILREEWGFEGFVTSDFVFGLRDPVGSVTAGLDIEMPFRQQRVGALPPAIGNATLAVEAVDECVTRTVATLLRFAEVVGSEVDPAVVAGPAHRALAREAAQKSIVLLRNDGVLPLDGAVLGRVAVLGRLAAVANLGDGGSSDVIAPDVVTPLAGLRAALEPLGVRIDHADDDPSIAEGADVAGVVVGFTREHEGEYIDASGTAELQMQLFPPITPADQEEIARAMAEREAASDSSEVEAPSFAPGGDRRSLALPVADLELIAAAAGSNERTVVVLMGGSATLVDPWREDVAAVVQLWYPGMEGGHALADVLLGEVNPSGRLPFSVPTDEAHLPHWDPDATVETYDLWHGHWRLTRDGHAPALPFGFGLSYTTFAIESLEVDVSGEGPVATVVVINTGDRDGDTVVQLYGGVPGSSFERPAERLVGFRRVTAAAGASVTVDVPIDLRQLHVRVGGEWWEEDGTYRFTAAQHVGDPGARMVEVELDGGSTGSASRPTLLVHPGTAGRDGVHQNGEPR